MKKKVFIAVFVIIVAAIVMSVVGCSMQDSLSTPQKRGEFLEERGYFPGEETENGFVAVPFYSSGKDGIAVFVPEDNGKYKYQGMTSLVSGSIVTESTIYNGEYYHLFYLNKSELDYAKVTFTVEGEEPKTHILDAGDIKVLYIKAPSEEKEYSMEINYCDIYGNVYR